MRAKDFNTEEGKKFENSLLSPLLEISVCLPLGSLNLEKVLRASWLCTLISSCQERDFVKRHSNLQRRLVHFAHKSFLVSNLSSSR